MSDAGRRMSAASRFLVAVCLIVAGFATPVAFAGDNTAILYVEEDSVAAEPGEEVTVDVLLSSHGGYGGDGVGEVAFTLEYDTDLLSVTDIEHGEWLADADADVATAEDHDERDGTLSVEHDREPLGEGTTGTDVILTLTLAVEADAEPTDAALEFTDSSVVLVNNYPQNVVDRDGTVAVAGGVSDDEANSSGDDSGVTLGNADDEADDGTADANESSGSTDGPDENADPPAAGGDDPMPGFAVPAVAIAALALFVGLVLSVRRSRRSRYREAFDDRR